jgi:hypothetical protein
MKVERKVGVMVDVMVVLLVEKWVGQKAEYLGDK